MSTATVTLELPEALYLRLVNTAAAMRRPLQEVVVRALTVGSPPAWEDVPAQFQSELAALDRLEDEALWQVAQARCTEDELHRYDELLEFKKERELPLHEQQELEKLRHEADLFMLRKAHAAALLRWRGQVVQPLVKGCDCFIRGSSVGLSILLGWRVEAEWKA